MHLTTSYNLKVQRTTLLNILVHITTTVKQLELFTFIYVYKLNQVFIQLLRLPRFNNISTECLLIVRHTSTLVHYTIISS